MRFVPANDSNGITTPNFQNRCLNSLEQVSAVVRMDQVRKNLCVSLTSKLIAEPLQAVTKQFVVFDDAVVNDADHAT